MMMRRVTSTIGYRRRSSRADARSGRSSCVGCHGHRALRGQRIAVVPTDLGTPVPRGPELRVGAGDGNRTRAVCLGSRNSAIELHPLGRRNGPEES
jgi:hypothetical protein